MEPGPADLEVDIALLGGGGAGLTLLLAIEAEASSRGLPSPSIAVIDPVLRAGADRTWCWWQPADAGTAAGGLTRLLYRSWSRIEVADRHGRPAHVELGDLRYVMLRSQDLYAEAARAIERIGVHRIQDAVTGLDDLTEPDGPAAREAVLIQAGQHRLRARWVFDSRPAPPQRAPVTALLQHFRGWTVRTGQPCFEPDEPILMDFQVPQPDRAVAFGYCLPLSADRALVEYTEFGRARLSSPEYDRALRGYLRQRFGLRDGEYQVEAVEDGAIPMTDAGYRIRAGRGIFRIGTAGGATRGSTGYTLAAAQRQAAVIARRFFDGQVPAPPPAYPPRHRWMDAVLLRALDRGLISGADLFFRLFSDRPAGQVLRFMDDQSSRCDELAVMRAAPALAMAQASAEDAMARVLRSVAGRYFKLCARCSS